LPARALGINQIRSPKRLSAWTALVLLVLAAAGATTGLVLQDSIEGDTSAAVSQAILVVGATECSSSDADEFLATVTDDGTALSVHFEANNGDTLCFDLKVANEAEQIIVAEMRMWGNSPYTFGSEPIFYWTDNNHNGKIDAGEEVVDQRTGSNTAILETSDTIVSTGTADLTDFSTNHWFFEGGGSYDDGEFSTDGAGSAPEAILLDDGNGWLVYCQGTAAERPLAGESHIPTGLGALERRWLW